MALEAGGLSGRMMEGQALMNSGEQVAGSRIVMQEPSQVSNQEDE